MIRLKKLERRLFRKGLVLLWTDLRVNVWRVFRILAMDLRFLWRSLADSENLLQGRKTVWLSLFGPTGELAGERYERQEIHLKLVGANRIANENEVMWHHEAAWGEPVGWALHTEKNNDKILTARKLQKPLMVWPRGNIYQWKSGDIEVGLE